MSAQSFNPSFSVTNNFDQSGGGSGAYPGNTRHEAGIHAEWDTSLLPGTILHTVTLGANLV